MAYYVRGKSLRTINIIGMPQFEPKTSFVESVSQSVGSYCRGRFPLEKGKIKGKKILLFNFMFYSWKKKKTKPLICRVFELKGNKRKAHNYNVNRKEINL